LSPGDPRPSRPRLFIALCLAVHLLAPASPAAPAGPGEVSAHLKTLADPAATAEAKTAAEKALLEIARGPGARQAVPALVRAVESAGPSEQLAAARALAAMNNPAAIRAAVRSLRLESTVSPQAALPVLAALGPEAVVTLAPSVKQPGEAGELALAAVQAVLATNQQAEPPAPLTPGARAALKDLVPVLADIVEKTPGARAEDANLPSEEAFREVRQREEHYIRRVFPALAILRAAGPDAAPALPVLDRQVKNPLRGSIHKECVQVLGAIGPGAVPVLERLAADEKFPFFREAREALDAIEQGAARPPDAALAEQVRRLRSQSPDERGAAAEALRRAGRPAVNAVLPLLEDPDPAVRSAAADALEGPAASKAVPALAKLCFDPRTTRAAAHALLRAGQDGGIALSQVFDERRARPQTPGVLAEVLKAVAEHRPPVNLAVRLDSLRVQGDLPRELVGDWIDAVAVSGAPEAAEPLRQVVLTQYPAPLRLRAAKALEKLGEPGRAALRQLAEEKDADAANPARAVLGLPAVEHPLDALAKGLDSPDRATRLQTVEQLRGIDSARARETLAARALGNPDEEVRARAVLALGMSTHAAPEGIDFVKLLNDPSSAVRQAAVSWSRNFPVTTPEPMMEMIRVAREDRVEAVRKAAGEVLVNVSVKDGPADVASQGGVLRPAVVDGLLGKLKSPAPRDRRLAGLALAAMRLEAPDVRAALKALLDDPDAAVRAAAVEGMASTGGAPALAEALRHSRPDVRLAAATLMNDVAMTRWGEQLLPELRKLAADGAAPPDALLYAGVLLGTYADRVSAATGRPAAPDTAPPFDVVAGGVRHARQWVRKGSAAMLLSAGRAAKAVKLLTDALDDPRPEVGGDASAVLVQHFAQQLAAAGPVSPDAAVRLTLSLADPDPVTRRGAAAELAAQGAGAGGVAGPLQRAMEQEQDPAVRRAMARALWNIFTAALAIAAPQPPAQPAASPAPQGAKR
jgi:HEAT repeat protein